MELQAFKTRSSTREFTDQKLSSQQLADLIEIINNAPTSTNAQQFSAIIITDPATKKWMSVKNFHQQHLVDAAAVILFVADRTRIKYVEKKCQLPQLSHDFLMHEFMRGVVDATIGASYAHSALMTMGFGVTYIGGPLTYAPALHKRLNLPASTTVVVGLSVGWPKAKGPFKPKMNKVFMNKYSSRQAIQDLKAYDQVLSQYYAKQNINSSYFKLIKNSLGGKPAYAKPFEAGGSYINHQLTHFD